MRGRRQHEGIRVVWHLHRIRKARGNQPGAAARIQTALIIGLALIESLAIYMLVVAMILLFVQPIK